jgi:hemoglobin/transferrin/lactoferrin receptor protein
MKYFPYILIALSIGCASAAYAQGQEPDTSGNGVVEMGEVVISANKMEETRKTISQQVQVMNEKDIANTQAQTTADVLANTGNVFIQKSQLGGGSVGLRGFEASRVLLVIDGVRMNNLIYRTGHLQNLVTTDNNSLERIEILFGPSSTVYGSDALGGVVHLYTKRPKLATETGKKFRANILSRYGAVDNENTDHIDFNIGGSRFASLTSVTYSQFGDLMGGKNQNPFYTGSYGERPFYAQRIDGKDSLVKNENRYLQVGSGYSQYDVVQKFLFKQNDNLTHSTNFQYSNSSNVPRYDRLTDRKGTGLNSAEWYYGPQTRLMAAYDADYRNPEGTFQGIHFGLNYQSIEESRHNRNFGSSNLNHRVENVQVIGANLDFQRRLVRHDIRFGADFQFNTLVSTASRDNIKTGATTKLDTRYPDGTNKMGNEALYFSHTWKISEKLTLNDGIRTGYSALRSMLVDTALQFHLPYTVLEQKTPVYSGSIGIIHMPAEDVKLSLLVSTGFRVPNVDDLSKIFASVPGTVIVPNPNLGPERTINYEAGVTKVFAGKTRWENVVYYTQFMDAIVTDKFTFNGQDSIMYDGTLSEVTANQNKGEAFIYGVSSNLVSRLDDHFSTALAINYTYGRLKTDTTDVPLDHISPFMARGSLMYQAGKFSSDFFVVYNGWKKLVNYSPSGEDNLQYATPVGMPAWFTVNLRASYKVHKLATFQAGVDNIFDTQYRVFASGINAPGRNIFAALRLHI